MPRLIPISTPTCTRRFEFDAAHRVLGHESKCRNVHGHRYVLDLTCAAPELDPLGRVIDFAQIKSIVGNWINDKIDHGYIAHENDPFVYHLQSTDGGMKNYRMNVNPTAENMVVMFAKECGFLLKPHGISVVHVRLYETPNCWADWESNIEPTPHFSVEEP